MRSGVLGLVLAAAFAGSVHAEPVRLKDLGRFQGERENALVGYGLVTGLAGTGDSPRNAVTQQALRNVLGRFGANTGLEQVRSRNVAAVMVMAALPPSARPGDRLDVTVTSVGDARSLQGGSLLMTPLLGPDQRTYVLAQGPLLVGGYRFDANQNSEQRNHPTSGVISGGGAVEAPATADLLSPDRSLTFILKSPDVTTAERLAEAINRTMGPQSAQVLDAAAVRIRPGADATDLYRYIARLEALTVEPDATARVVVNERSGTVVAGAGVRISSVVISQGDIRVSVSTENVGSQPLMLGGYAPELSSLVVTNTKLAVTSPPKDAVATFPSTTVADLVQGLSKVHVDTRDLIAILQSLKAAGALHADIIVQ